MAFDHSQVEVATSFDDHIIDVIIGLCVPGIAFSVALLLGFAYLAWHPTSRRHLNRVSFRLLVYALISNASYASILVLTIIPTGPSAACTFVAFASEALLMFSAGLFFCISLNLQLVLVHGVDGRRLEKYYVLGAGFLSAACNITTLAAGNFGYLAAGDVCWFNHPDPQTNLRWIIGARTVPILFLSASAIASFIVLASFMVRNQLRATRVLSNTPESTPTPPVVRYRGIIFRIGMYPLCSCLLNFSGCILDLYLGTRTELTPLARRLGVLDLCIFALRALLYALLGATDPSFLRALRALRYGDPASGTQTASTQSGSSRRTKRFSYGTQALIRVDFEQVADRPSMETRGPSGDARGPSIETRGPLGVGETRGPSGSAETRAPSGETLAREAQQENTWEHHDGGEEHAREDGRDLERGLRTDAQGVQFPKEVKRRVRRTSRAAPDGIASQI